MPNKKVKKLDEGSKKQKPYTPMEIARVKLNPEQAVISCCDASHRRIGVMTYMQCDTPCSVGATPVDSPSS